MAEWSLPRIAREESAAHVPPVRRSDDGRAGQGGIRMTASPLPSDGIRLRPWQTRALQAYDDADRTDFLVTATPGAGKTTFALALAIRLIERRAVDRVIVVAPTDHLRTQWAHAAARFGLDLDPTLSNGVGPVRADMRGYVTTYAQVAAAPMLHRARTENRRSLVVLD